MNKLITNTAAFFTSFKKDERGVTAIEYGLIGVAMATLLAVVFSVESFEGNSLLETLEHAYNSIRDAIAVVSPATES